MVNSTGQLNTNISTSHSMLELRSKCLALLASMSTIGYTIRSGLTSPEHQQVERTMRRQRTEVERHRPVSCRLDVRWFGRNCREKY